MKLIRKRFSLLVLLLTLLGGSTIAADYVDEINTAAGQRALGRRVIYEMNVGSFTQAGTFSAAQAQLGELKRLGIDIVWLMPIYPRGGGINSPYAATNFQQVNPAYGTIADLKSFVAAAHELDMLVWLDWVPNHTATNADWVTTHPEYYVKSGTSIVHPNNYSDVYQLDYSNPNLCTAMNDCLKFWIDQADIDGYRCDYISSRDIPTSYWQSTIPMIKNYKIGKTITFLGEADIASDVTRLKTAGFEYDYAWGYQTSLLNYGPTGVYSSTLKANVNNQLITPQSGISFGRMVYLTNHDQNHNESKKTLTDKYGNNRYPLTVLAATVWGMPLIYNSQEVGGNQDLNYFQDTKINWNNPDTKMHNMWRTLTALKHAVPAFQDGLTTATHHTVTWLTASPATNVLAYLCEYDGSQALVILNLATSTTNVTVSGITAGDWSMWLTSETIAQGVSRHQQTLAASQSFTIEAKGFRVYVKGTYSEEDIPEPGPGPVVDVYTPVLENESEISVFFESPTSDTYYLWAWNGASGGENYCTNPNWPGDQMTLKGQTTTGNYIYKCILTKPSEAPASLIISKQNGNTKIYNGVAFVNHGYYVEGNSTPTQVITTVTGIRDVTMTAPSADGPLYTLGGQCVTASTRLPRGVYIQNGRKMIVK